MHDSRDLPDKVRTVADSAEADGFAYSCEPAVGWLLAALAAAAPPGARILELGTGAGVGTAWLTYGVGDRTDVSIVSIEQAPSSAALAARHSWPAIVELRLGDAEELLPELGSFDLVFADAEGGKWSGLGLTLDSLRPGGVLLVDDMDPGRYDKPEHRAVVQGVARVLRTDPRLVAVELPAASGIIIAVRRREGA